MLVAIDGSDHSEKALETACDIAKKYSSILYLVHSPQLETTAIAVGSGAVEIKPDAKAIAEAGQAVMSAARDKAKALDCVLAEGFVGNQDPADEILRSAAKIDADLIVMGRRGLGGIASLLLGSVSQKVSHGAKCTCLTVHH
jgi:nucleotide-binding universal stress UspA family protein